MRKKQEQISEVNMSFSHICDDYISEKLDFNKLLINHKAATYLMKMSVNSMIDAGILDGDILVVDRGLNIENNSIIVAQLDNDFLIRRYKNQKNQICLMPEVQKVKTICLNRTH